MRAALLVLSCLLSPCAAAAAEVKDSYAIAGEDATETSRVVSLRIDRRLAQADLVRIATAIKDRNSHPAIRHTVVSFYLPKMPLDQRPWASVDLTPVPKAVVGGLRLEEEQALAAEAAADRRALIGTWLTELPASPGRISIYNDRGKIFLEWALRSGQKSTDEVVAMRGTRATRFDVRTGADDYYLMKSSGELELRNKSRLIAVAERIVLPKAAPALMSSKAVPVPAAASIASMQPAAASQVAYAPALAATAAPAGTVLDSAAVTTPPTGRKRVARRSTIGRRPASNVFAMDYAKPLVGK